MRCFHTTKKDKLNHWDDEKSVLHTVCQPFLVQKYSCAKGADSNFHDFRNFLYFDNQRSNFSSNIINWLMEAGGNTLYSLYIKHNTTKNNIVYDFRMSFLPFLCVHLCDLSVAEKKQHTSVILKKLNKIDERLAIAYF